MHQESATGAAGRDGSTTAKPAARIPVSLVTGFLGSGKTTLIKALLRRPSMEGTAVVVNEFGAVGIDDAIFAESLDDHDVVLLANGCLCCAAGDDLARAVWSLTQRSPDRPQRIVIETSGLADPAPALRRLMADPRLRPTCRLDALVATVDAIDGLSNLDTQPLALRQCAVADRRVITKTDIAGVGRAEALAVRLFAINPGSPPIMASNGDVDPEALFGAALYDSRRGRADLDRWLGLEGHRSHAGEAEPHTHGHGAHSWLVEESRPVSWNALSPRIADIVTRHGDRLLRLKGVIHIAGDARPLVIHGVQRVFHTPVRLSRWPGPAKTSIVVIGEENAAAAVDAIGEALRAAALATDEPARISN